MKVTLGKSGLQHSMQQPFPETTKCCRCATGEARIGFVAHESADDITPQREDDEGNDRKIEAVCQIHVNEGPREYWLHDLCAVAVYFCKDCLETTALSNQG